ncbi:MAG: hypothetical protein WCP86_02485 [bacterium]
MNAKCMREQRCAKAPDCGAALVLILLLVGVVATLTISTQSSLALVHRYARTKQIRHELRLVASDAAWCFLRDRVKKSPASAQTGALPAASTAVLPSGVETRVEVTDSTDALLAAIPFLGNKSVAGRVFVLKSSASLSNTAEQVSCIYRRDKSGVIEVLGWHQER